MFSEGSQERGVLEVFLCSILSVEKTAERVSHPAWSFQSQRVKAALVHFEWSFVCLWTSHPALVRLTRGWIEIDVGTDCV